ncbi:MAG: hypothetical protein RTV41_00090 [Candidatus Thorarchaeota archaeon]
MRRGNLIGILVVVLFLFPMLHTSSDYSPVAAPATTFQPLYEGGTSTWANNDPSTGVAPALPVSISGQVSNQGQGTLLFDSSSSGVGSVTLTDGWTGSDLQAEINSLQWTAEDVLQNGALNDYHVEQFIVTLDTTENDDAVQVPDSWALIKNVVNDNQHPQHGVWELDSDSGGYGSTRGIYLETQWGSSYTHTVDDEIFLRQMVSIPWREVYSATVTFRYRVSSSTDLADQVHLFVRLGGDVTKFNVFETGDTTDTWLTATTTIPASSMTGLSTHSLLFDIGLATDLEGQTQSLNSYSYIDDIVLDFDVRPFPEQVDLKANGTLVWGSTTHSVYPYVPDDDNRDCYDDVGVGIDLDGYGNDGGLNVGMYSSGYLQNTNLQVGLQFPLEIPVGAIVTSAYLEVEAFTGSSPHLQGMRLFVADVTNSSSFTTGLPELEDRYSWLDAYMPWSVNSWIDGPEIRYRSPEIGPFVQSVVGNSTWVKGNYVTLMLDHMYSDYYQRWNDIKGTSDFDNENRARLFVEYLIPEAEDTILLFDYQKDITVDHNDVVSDLTDFPVLIDIATDSDLSSHVLSNGNDIVFTVDGDPVAHEIELFNQTTGQLVAWVKVHSLSSSTDTIITMHYGCLNAPPTLGSKVWSDYETVHHLNQDPSGINYDSTSNNHDGTSYGGLDSSDLATGQIGNAIDFDGTNDIVSIGQIDTDEWTQFTMSAWIYRSLSKDARVFSKSLTTTPDNHIITLRIDGGDYVTTRIQTDGAGGFGASYSGSPSASNFTWHYIVWSWSASRGSILAYLDGVEILDQTHGGTSIYDSDAMFVIGNNDLTNDRYWAGLIDEARLTTSIRTEDWIDTEYNNQNNPSGFYTVGTEEETPNTWTDAGETEIFFTTSSPTTVSMDVIITMDIGGEAQTMDTDFNEGVSYFIETGSSYVNWTAKVMVSPPAGADSFGFTVEYPRGEWKPTTVLNPMNQRKTLDTDWSYQGGTLTLDPASIDFWGVWTLKFISWNVVQEIQPTAAVYDINDLAKFTITTPTIIGARAALDLVDPDGNTWFSSYNQTTTDPSHRFPSFKYRKDITIGSGVIYGNVENFPVLIQFNDDTDLHDTTKLRVDGNDMPIDLLFADGDIVLDHEIEYFDQDYTFTEAQMSAWVKMNLTMGSDKIISMYYGSPIVDNLENPQGVWSNGFDAVWHLGEVVTDEASGAIHADSAGGGYDGVQNGNDEYTNGRAGYAQDFDGTDDYISISDQLTPEGDVFITGWFRLDSTHNSASPNTQVIMEKFIDPDQNMVIALAGQDYGHGSVNDGSLVFKVESSSDAKYTWTSTIISWSAGWHFVGCYADEDNPDNNKIWIDAPYTGGGWVAVSQTGSPTQANVSYVEEWRLGGGDWDSGTPGIGWFDGQLDEFRVASALHSDGWLSTEYRNQNTPGSFGVRGSEIERTSPEHTISKTMDSSAPAGLWTAIAYYNDTGATVTNKVGLIEETFTVRHHTALTLQEPSVTTKTVGDALIVEYELTDTDTPSGVAGATVTMNWTSPATITLDDYGNGFYGKVLDTSDLGDAQQWSFDIASAHPYYVDDTDTFTLDLYHNTLLDAADVTTTPAGEDFTATLTFTDTYSGAPISGATITLDGSGVTFFDNLDGTYDISITTGALSLGDHSYIFNATKAGNYVHMGSVQVTFTLRAHNTVVAVSGDFTTPHGQDTTLTVFLLDLDTGLEVDITDVALFNYSYAGVFEEFSSLFSYTMDLDTETWSVGTVTVTLTITISDSNILNPTPYDFDVTIRAHRTSLSVTGVLTQPYGNQTPLSIILTDLDTGEIVPIGQVTNIHLAWAGGSDDSSIYNILLDTSAWLVGDETVTVTAVLSSIYQAPSSYQFTISIRSMITLMYHDPSTLNFPIGADFDVYLRLNTTEPGPYYSDPITGRLAGEFSVPGYTEVIGTSEQAIGRYRLTIAGSAFSGGTYQITVYFTSADTKYADTFIVIQFEIRPIVSYLTSPNYPQVTTPFQLDVKIVLNYTDADFGFPIDGATITSPDHPTWIANWTDIGGGLYDVWIDVSSLTLGLHTISLTADKAEYIARTLEFRVVIRAAFTSIVPSVGSLVIPIGNSPIFYVDYTDIDRFVPIDNSTSDTEVISSWGTFSVVYESGSQRYRITFHTSDSDTISQNIVYSFTFSKGVNYQAASFNITVSIRTHNTDFRIVSSIEPTSTIGVFNISVYYGDLDSAVGIKSLLVDFWVENATGVVSSSYGYDILGDGYYIIQVSASQFGLGLQTFTVYADWTGAVAKYQDKSFVTTANVVGRDSALTLLIGSEPTPYDENMGYLFFYSDLFSGVGIDNLTGNVFIYVQFQGESAGQSDIVLTDFSATQPGNYSIFFDTNIFSRTGLIYMNVFVNWSKGVSPFYSNRTDVISVRVLPRDTLLSITPPSPTSYGETATFTFTFEDITGGSSSFILDDPKLSITSNITFGYMEIGGTYTLAFDTTQFGDVGVHVIQLSVTWDGIPFYSNRTGRILYLTVINRVTFLEYLAPAPTQYLDEVIFNVTWTDITGGASDPITGAAVTLYDDLIAINSMYYSVVEVASGIYQITLNTTYVSNPGLYDLRVGISIGVTGIPNVLTTRQFNIQERRTLLAAEPITTVPYNSSIDVVLYYQDLFTNGVIANDSSSVTLEILDGPGSGPWFFTVTWRSGFGDYLLEVQTYNLALETGVPYTLTLRMSYAFQAPFYSSDELIIEFQVRDRVSTLGLATEPETTPYGDNAVFTVFFGDVDASGAGILGATITIPSLTLTTEYNVVPGSVGYYIITVDTSALGSPTSYPLTVHADWFGSPYHTNMTRDITVLVRERETNIDITIPPSQTLYLDDVTFTFQYSDLDASVPITLIDGSNIHLYWESMVEINPLLYTVTPTGSYFEITIASDDLSATPVSGLSIILEVDWNAASIPYYVDDSTTVKVTITGRSILVESDQIDRTPKGDIVNISISLTDIDNGNPISGAIIQFSCQFHGLVEGVDYTRTEGAGVYTFHVDSDALSGTGTFFFDIEVQWNPTLAPFYSNRSVVTLTGLVDFVRTSLSVDALTSSVQFTGEVSLLLSLRDLDHNLPITGYAAIIQSNVEYLISGLQPAGLVVFETGTPGEYNVSFNTSDLPTLGSYTLDITIPASAYASSTVTPQFSVVEINTELTPLATSDMYNWTDIAYIYVDYRNLLDYVLISGATVSYSIGGAFGDYLDEPGTPGQYRATIDTNQLGFSGTQVITITATLDKYTIATTTVTLVILALPSDIVIIDPPTGILDVSRGNPVSISVRLYDTLGATWINNLQVETIYATFDAVQYSMSWDALSSTWNATLPGSSTILDPGSYDVQITAGFYDFQVAGDQFRINIQQTETLLEVRDPLTGEILSELDTVYSEVIELRLNLTEKAGNTTVELGQVFWYESAFNGLNLTFTYNDTLQLWVAEFNTSLGFYGTWGLTFRAFPDDPILAPSTTTLTLTIKKIETEVWAPPLTIYVDWGWVGNISFTYYDTSFDRGIANATVLYDYGELKGLLAHDLGNGTYLVFINATHLDSNAQHRILLDLQKQNFEERTSGANLFVEARSTELIVEVDDERTYESSRDTTELEIPMGDSVNITFFYNDISPIVEHSGGLAFATFTATLSATPGTYLIDPRNVTGFIVELGDGWYSFIFDTNDLSLYESTNETQIILNGQFFLAMHFEFLHRDAEDESVIIKIITTPSELERDNQIVDPDITFEYNLTNGLDFVFDIYYNDTWHDLGIDGAVFHITSGVITTVTNTSIGDGLYRITIKAVGYGGDSVIQVTLSKEFHDDVTIIFLIHAQPSDFDTLVLNMTTYGLPISIGIILLLGAYVRVWSVPKRIRQINGQIKNLRKGKIPKPIGDVKSRQELVADLFNDTYAEMKITRTAEQMPEDAIPIDVPEMGELLMQLSILTNLSTEELDEFQADIIKMKPSEQAAFVKEVIMQEAIRAARRDKKTVDEIIAAVEAEALRRLGAEEEVEPIDVVDTGPVETMFIDEEEVVTSEIEDTPEKDTFEEVTETTSEKMSMHEIEELRKDLEEKGVPLHEIDTIIEQAKELPRELVDELVKSLEGKKE